MSSSKQDTLRRVPPGGGQDTHIGMVFGEMGGLSGIPQGMDDDMLYSQQDDI